MSDLVSEQEYDACRAAENLAELTCPELQGPEWHLDRNGQYPGYQRAEREPAARYLQEDGSDDDADRSPRPQPGPMRALSGVLAGHYRAGAVLVSGPAREEPTLSLRSTGRASAKIERHAAAGDFGKRPVPAQRRDGEHGRDRLRGVHPRRLAWCLALRRTGQGGRHPGET